MKDAIVGEVEDEAAGSEVARDREARAQRLLVKKELVVIPAQAGGDGPVVWTEGVLDKRGLFKIRALAGEGEGEWREGIELRRVGDRVVEVFVEEGVVGFDAELQLVASAIRGERCFEVAFAKAVVLEDLDGRGPRVGGEVAGVVAHHAAQVKERLRGQDVFPRGDAHGLEVVGGLTLPGGLLDGFVGQVVARDLVAHAQAHAVAGGNIAQIVGGEVFGGAGIGVVLGDDGIEVVFGGAAAGTGTQSVFT